MNYCRTIIQLHLLGFIFNIGGGNTKLEDCEKITLFYKICNIGVIRHLHIIQVWSPTVDMNNSYTYFALYHNQQVQFRFMSIITLYLKLTHNLTAYDTVLLRRCIQAISLPSLKKTYLDVLL